jgi:imidazolonepropionase-like amidohydrolase
MKISIISLVFLCVAQLLSVTYSSASELMVVYAGTVIVTPEEKPEKNQTLVVKDGLIASIHDGYLSPDELGLKDPVIIDLQDQYVLPGFIDTHVHLTTPNEGPVKTTDADLAISAAINARRVLAAGFTTVMDLGTGTRDHELAVYAVRDAINAGKLMGPEILAAGSPISAVGFSRTGRYRDNVEAEIGPEGACFSTDTCRGKVLEQIYRGADIINVYNTGSMLAEPSAAQTLTTDELRTIAETSAALGRVVIADGGNSKESAAGINNAILAGFKVIDTVTYPDANTFKLLKKYGGFFAPHLYALQAAVGDSSDSLEEGSMGGLPPQILQKLYEIKQETPSALLASRQGVSLIIASDSGVFPHGDNARELLAYAQLGISNKETLKAATINAASAFQIDDRTGSISVGKEADMVAFRDNPLESINTVLEPTMVMSNGRILLSK